LSDRVRSAPIGVFDSGIGGLTVVRALRRRLPAENIVYLGDIARSPYGTKSADTISRFAREDARFLAGRGVKMIVVACHSASSAALPGLAGGFRMPVLGVIEPGARAVVAATRTGRVAVIGTAATIASAAYERAIRAVRRDVEIVAKPTPLFVPLAEEGWLDGQVVELAAQRYLSGLKDDGIDAVLLGCTHFPLLAPVIGHVLGPAVRVVDSSEETAVAVERVLRQEDVLSESAPGNEVPGSLKVYLTDLSPNFPAVGARFLGEHLGDVVRATLGEA
jgi:glutamate racemase